MVLEGQVDGPVLAIKPSLLRVFLENSLLLCGQRPCWDVCRASRFGWEDKVGSGYVCILFGREDEAKVSVLASAKVALDGLRVHCQELMCLLYGSVVQISGLFGD